jgi:sulfide:quinone oxidoreductase
MMRGSPLAIGWSKMIAEPSADRFKVLIVGAGVAALEGALALVDLGGERLELTLLAPEAEFRYRPMAVVEPFAYRAAERHSVAEIAADIGARLVVERLASIDAAARVVHTESGAQIDYDAVLLALGARAHVRFPHALTIDDARLDEQLHGLIEDVDGGYVQSIAFVVPARMAWPLPIYELALMTARRAFEMQVALAATIVTPEDRPLAVFGDAASAACSELLAAAGIAIVTRGHCEVPDSRHVVINPGDRTLEANRIISLPELFGPAVRGLRADEHGFIPIDGYCAVAGVASVFAAGDATDSPIKHGGLAAQQADTAAASIAALAGLDVAAEPLRAVIHGILLTGAEPLYVTAHLSGDRGIYSEVGRQPGWTADAKITARHLGPYLEARAKPSSG